MAINDVAGERVYLYEILREFLCHNFVSGLRTLKPKRGDRDRVWDGVYPSQYTLRGAQGLCSSVENVLFLCVNGALWKWRVYDFMRKTPGSPFSALPFSSLFFFTSSSVHSPR